MAHAARGLCAEQIPHLIAGWRSSAIYWAGGTSAGGSAGTAAGVAGVIVVVDSRVAVLPSEPVTELVRVYVVPVCVVV
jgi:hypothetical protein